MDTLSEIGYVYPRVSRTRKRVGYTYSHEWMYVSCRLLTAVEVFKAYEKEDLGGVNCHVIPYYQERVLVRVAVLALV
jgi:hypothetical protein